MRPKPEDRDLFGELVEGKADLQGTAGRLQVLLIAMDVGGEVVVLHYLELIELVINYV